MKFLANSFIAMFLFCSASLLFAGGEGYTVKKVKEYDTKRTYRILCEECGKEVYIDESYKTGKYTNQSFWSSSSYNTLKTAAFEACRSKCN